jgi:hypothetical protein
LFVTLVVCEESKLPPFKPLAQGLKSEIFLAQLKGEVLHASEISRLGAKQKSALLVWGIVRDKYREGDFSYFMCVVCRKRDTKPEP